MVRCSDGTAQARYGVMIKFPIDRVGSEPECLSGFYVEKTADAATDAPRNIQILAPEEFKQ